MELEMRVMDQFVNEEGSDQERMCWRKIRSAICEANSNTVLADVLDDWIKDLETEDIYILPKLLEKMKSFRVKHFS
jgi:hypothetical protein